MEVFNEDRKVALELYEKRLKKKRGFYLSLIFPGLGQLYQGRYLTGALFLLFFLFPFYYVYLIGKALSYGGITLISAQALLYALQAYDARRGVKRETSPCEEACPAKVNVPSFMSYCQTGEFKRAYGSFLARAPFPFTLGQVCPAPCEEKCGVLPGRPLRIREVHGQFGKMVLESVKVKERKPFFPLARRKVAVVGGGVAGITVAYYLASCGVEVELFEKESELGGTLRFVPDFKLDKELFKREIELLTSFKNLKVHLGKEVLKRPSGFDLVVAAVGALVEKKLPLKGERVVYPLSFLKSPPEVKGKRVVVIGAGDTAFDIARLTVRLGGEALVFYRGSFEGIKASRKELSEAVKEGVRVYTNCDLISIEGRTAKLSCGEVKYDYLVPALGFEVDRELLRNISGDFIAGDAGGGMSTAVNAIGHAREVAYEVLKELSLSERAWFVEDFYAKKPSKVSGSNLFVVSESSLCEHCGLKVRS
ncbi:FAD-dependent oxidoreductase [Thermovibrio sp.]